jgi:uncharacterized tellurite resistance protein B-like protein
MSSLDDILTLLALSIVADGRVADEEIGVFKKAVTQIHLSDLDIILPSEDDAIAWFSRYHHDIREIAFGEQDDFEHRLTELLYRLSAHIRPEALLHTLQMIAISDGELHINERRLIAFIKAHFGSNAKDS